MTDCCVWLEPPLVPDERKKSPVCDADSSDEYKVEPDEARSLLEAARVPVAISMAAGASTAVIVCHEEGALDKSSTSTPACRRSLALFFLASTFGLKVVVVVVVVGVDGVVDGAEVVEVVEGFVADDVFVLSALDVCC